MKPRYEEYESPFVTRYAPEAMRRNFSALKKFQTWRRLWIALAQSQEELGLPVTKEQVKELESCAETINFDVAAKFEKELRHDVMAHIRAYGEQCPKAAGIIHLGATSCFVTDNTDVLIFREAARLVRIQLLSVIRALAEFARKYADTVTTGYTHFQPAQPVTVGKRATLWIQDLLIDLEQLDFAVAQLKFRGVKGASGTQASALMLFEGDEVKVEELDRLVAEKFGFDGSFPVTGQTYPRKADFYLLGALSGIAQSANKFATDMRLLSGFREMSEMQGKSQVGSSAMPQKANPMRSERICALARYAINSAQNAAFTASQQWLERSLDDSANRRIVVPEMFMAVSGILNIYLNVAGGIVVNEEVIQRRLTGQLPFLTSEGILMAAVRRGGDRQALHERLRVHALEARKQLESGGANDFLDRVKRDPMFASVEQEIDVLADPARLAGRSSSQVAQFLSSQVEGVLDVFSTDGDDSVSEDLKV